MHIKLIQIDGDLPNMALMKLAHHYRYEKGAEITFTKSVRVDMFEPKYDAVFASAIFSVSAKKVALLKDYCPEAIIGGTGINEEADEFIENYPDLDYSIYPDFPYSIGMTQIGCSSKCPFCCVPNKEGKNRPKDTIAKIWRGDPYPRQLILIDNDFQNRDGWQSICEEIIEGDFEVAFIQGINIRKLTPEHATYFSRMKFRDRNFNRKKFYCAWDNEKDRKRIERGLDILATAGIQRSDVTPYFLCNYWHKGLTEDVWTRFLFMAERGLRPYCMVYEKWKLPPNDDLKIFQNWINSHNCYVKPTREGFEEYKIYRISSKVIHNNDAEIF